MHCFRQDCYWLDIGRHDDYATAANEIFDSRRAAFPGGTEKPKLQDRTRPVNSTSMAISDRADRLPDRRVPSAT